MLLLVGLSAFAQLTTGNLTGTVTTGGAPLPGVTVSLAASTLQGTRTAVTDSNGAYNFQGLPPGDYTVTFTLEGLQTATRSVKVGVSSTSRADADMKVSALSESITVTATSPAVLETQQVQTNITSHLVENLPMGRTLVATTNLAPNVTPTGPNGGLIIAGGQSYDSTYYVDGAVVNEVLRGQPQNLFIEDALQETTVQSGAISSEFGRFTGGVVTAVSKTGGNTLTGSLRDTVERPSWTSQTKFTPFTITSNSLQSQYEGTLGGPIVKDRLWFFGAGRYFNISSPETFTRLPIDTASVPYSATDKEERLEVKLTGQITNNHSLTGSYFNISRHQTGNCQGGCLEPAALQAPRSLPNKFYTLNYDGVISKNFFLEGNYAKQLFSFVGGGGVQGPPETNTPINVIAAGGYANNPLFCGNCSAAEQRNNKNTKLKGTYFWSPKNWGTHNLSVGVEDYSDFLKGNNEQSGSNFIIYDYDAPARSANGDLSLTMQPGDGLIIWFPILQASQGNKLDTKSLFANDKWDFGSHWSFNIGARYDKNHAHNQAGATIANDSKISPRLGAIYDVMGNGKVRLNASYSEYVSKIAEGNVADVSSPAGAGSYLYWYYAGDPLVGLTPAQMDQQVFSWFNSVGGTKNTDFLLGGATSGISTVINGTLKSPGVKEWTGGIGSQLTPRAFLRADYQYRKWNNFYTQIVNTSTGQVFDPLANQNLDLNLVENTNDFKRNY
ncbi:MAG TPA: TonB-dependent receptor, partial [Thermoanaerobaculia bacterium]|nr:TonB-dependent receptor [Thermoanaerobaculia bacterium]